MKLLNSAQYDELVANSRAQGDNMRLHGSKDDFADLDFKPVVKFFTPDAQCTWLITEMDQDGRLFGLCDLGQGEPELGYVLLEELEEGRGFLGLAIEVDKAFTADKTLSEYYEIAKNEMRIVT